MPVDEDHGLPLYIVHWHDSRQPRGTWQHAHDVTVEGPVKVVSVGWLLYSEAPSVIMLAPHIGDTDNSPQVSGVIEIPRLCITKMHPISGAEDGTSTNARDNGFAHECKHCAACGNLVLNPCGEERQETCDQ